MTPTITRLRGTASDLIWTEQLQKQVNRTAEIRAEDGDGFAWRNARNVCASIFAREQKLGSGYWQLAAGQNQGPHRLLGGNAKGPWPEWAEELRGVAHEYIRVGRLHPRAFVVHLDRDIDLSRIPAQWSSINYPLRGLARASGRMCCGKANDRDT